MDRSRLPTPVAQSTAATLPAALGAATVPASSAAVLRSTYMLLSMTLLFSAAVATASAAWKLPAPGILITLVGFYGLLFGIYKMRDSLWSLPMVFALTGFMGYTLGPVLSRYAGLPGCGETIAMALGLTGVTFVAMSAYAIQSRRDFSFLGGFLLAGMVIAVLAGLAAMFFEMPALSLAVSAAVALLSAGLILFETSNIVNGGETSPVMATVSLFVSIFNLFSSLLSLLGLGGSEE